MPIIGKGILLIGGAVELTIQGAPTATVSYTGKESGSIVLDSAGDAVTKLKPGTYTFTDSISGYSVTEIITAQTTVVAVMPTYWVYWYGRRKEFTTQYCTVTWNTNNFEMRYSSTWFGWSQRRMITFNETYPVAELTNLKINKRSTNPAWYTNFRLAAQNASGSAQQYSGNLTGSATSTFSEVVLALNATAKANATTAGITLVTSDSWSGTTNPRMVVQAIWFD